MSAAGTGSEFEMNSKNPAERATTVGGEWVG